MKKYLSAATTGIGYGSFVYLLILSLGNSLELPNQENILSVLFMSAGIGIVSLLFDCEEAPFWLLLILHFLGTFSLVLLMILVNHWFSFVSSHFLSFFSFFFLIYVFVWIIIRIKQTIEVKKMNKTLKKRKNRLDK